MVENLSSCKKCGMALPEGETICAVCKADQGQGNSVIAKRGNSAGNILQGGHAVLHGDWIYYSGSYHDSRLQRISCDGSKHDFIDVEHALFLNAVDDWIYYANGNEQFRIFKIRPDGTERTQVCDEASSSYNYLNIVDGWLYYQSGNKEEQRINKMKLDGSEHTELYQSENELIFKMGVAGDWIFFDTSDKNRENRKIYKLHSVSKEKFLVNDKSYGQFTLNNEWLYYSDQNSKDQSPKLSRMSIDGSKCGDLITGYVGSLNASDLDGWVYYAKYSENEQPSGVIMITDCVLYKIRPDGTEETRIIKAPADNLLIVGDWIIYTVYNAYEDERLCRVRKDGGGRQFII